MERQGSGDGGSGYGSVPVPVERQLLPPAPQQQGQEHGQEQGITHEQDGGAEMSDGGKGKGKEREMEQGGMMAEEEPLPLCGLPIGAGPEGTSHMLSWRDCPLRRSGSMLAITRGGEVGEVEGVREDEGQEDEGTGEDEEREGGSEGQGRMTPPSPLRRRHSAAT
jgi:hypothetical protein